jgi:hypothetical protein
MLSLGDLSDFEAFKVNTIVNGHPIEKVTAGQQ